MESPMRKLVAAGLVAACGMLAGAPAKADWIPKFKGNDTGGIIAWELAHDADARQLAVRHCAKYGKVAKFLAVDPQYGGYLSFFSRPVPVGPKERQHTTNDWS